MNHQKIRWMYLGWLTTTHHLLQQITANYGFTHIAPGLLSDTDIEDLAQAADTINKIYTQIKLQNKS